MYTYVLNLDVGGDELPNPTAEVAELLPEQLQNLRKDQLTALLAALTRTSTSTPSEMNAKPVWELDDLHARPGEAEAPLRFLVWRDQEMDTRPRSPPRVA